MRFHIIASGSKGNATIVFNKDTRILIDMGISLCRLNEGLEEIGFTLNDLQGAIFTHNHSDHISGLKFLSPKKCFALEGTLPPLCNAVLPYKPFQIGSFIITPLRTSHDATNPCGYFIEDLEESLVYMTDTGVVLPEVIPFITNPDYLIIESNHDIGMEYKTSRPFDLKARILGEHGHLCNEDSALAALKIIGDNTKEIVLAHLSEEANAPEIALQAYKNIFDFSHVDITKYKIRCASQYVSLSGGNDNEN